MNKFSICYADPSWMYQDKATAGKRGACHKYPVMTIPEICALPVDQIMAPDAALFMWVTAPFLFDAKQVIEAWKFKYKTVAFVWVKMNKKAHTYFWGMGNHTRSNAEFVLLATRGNIKRVDKGVHQIIQSKIRGHSQKPECVREKIVKLMGDIPRIELFARESAKGWVCRGNELDGGRRMEETLREFIPPSIAEQATRSPEEVRRLTA
jgi:N6-adenosine-specific RNA methylase IME4